jgi:HEAT repeat protein
MSDPIEELRRTGEKLPEPLRDAVFALGHDAVPRLLEILESESDLEVDSPSQGWAPMHAANLLLDLRATEAIEPLLRTLKTVDCDAIIYNVIAVGLPKLGAPVLEPALLMLEQELDEDPRHGIYEILSNLGVRDERIFRVLNTHYANEVGLGAICFGNYGDERALPLLRQGIEEFEPDWSSGVALLDLDELKEAYEAIAGQLPPDLASRVAELKAQWREWEPEVESEEPPNAPAVSTKIGRNEPCPCGSGRKYKKCCGSPSE